MHRSTGFVAIVLFIAASTYPGASIALPAFISPSLAVAQATTTGLAKLAGSGIAARVVDGADGISGSTSPTPLRAVVYDDAIGGGFYDRSTARHSLRYGETVHGGRTAIAFEPDRRQALHFVASAPVQTARFNVLELWVHGGDGGGQKVRVAAFAKGALTPGVRLEAYLSGGAVERGRWARVQIPLADLGVQGDSVEGVWIASASSGDQPVLFLDDIAFVRVDGVAAVSPARARPRPTPRPGTISIDPEADRRPINPHVYGASFGSQAQLERLEFPARRWGGNHTSRYAWDVDATNRAMDWFFLNLPEDNPSPASLPHGSAADRFIDETLVGGGEPLVTVPMIGWVAKDREIRAGFSVEKYGRQQAEFQGAGNGRWPNGESVTGNDPHDTSREVGPEYVTAWLAHIASRVGAAGAGGVRFFALDNELTLWPETHRDIHPGPVTYDEIWQKTLAYASAIKAQDPQAELFGPVAWGWCAYFDSSGHCGGSDDQKAHGGKAFLPWYLDQVCAHERATGTRLVDYLTIHYYPQQSRVYSPDDSPEVAAGRLRAVKSLYDPNYGDESWIPEPVALIPRMRRWIDEHCPGIKLAITEYSFGNDNGPSGALAQAETLAIFGREGVDFATRWTAPNEGEWTEDAFALFRNYDGRGSKVEGDSVRAVTWDADSVASYAVRDEGRLYVLLFNKQPRGENVRVEVDGGVRGSAQLFGFDVQDRLGARTEAVARSGGFDLELPARSATLAVIDLAGG